MLGTVWRFSSENFDVIEFCDHYQIQNIATMFVQGEKGCKNKINEKSGFNVLVSENNISKNRVNGKNGCFLVPRFNVFPSNPQSI